MTCSISINSSCIPRWLLLICVFLIAFKGHAQETLYPISDVNTFQKRLKEESAHIQSIEADFTQLKHLSVFEEEVLSKGVFYYKKEDNVRMDYLSPVNYLMVMKGQQLKIVSGDKTNVVNLGNNPMMKEMKTMISACMVGDLTLLSGAYTFDYLESDTRYVVKIVPNAKSVSAYIREMIVTLDKKDMSVVTLRLTEGGGDYTEYHFISRKFNTLTTDEKFTIN